MSNLLDRINKAGDIKKIRKEDQRALACEIRRFLIEKVSSTGGHLASNLGAVEITMALHLCFDLPKDKIIWDVGHQSYTHKLLTGRKRDFDKLRQIGGISGFPKRSESEADAFNTGHSSTSISAAIGYCRARDLRGENYHVAAVIGDGSMTGGMAYEALNDANSLKSNLIIILNDNEMSISKNVGGMSKYLNKIRTKDSYLELKDAVKNKLSRIPGGEGIIDSIQDSKVKLRRKLIGDGFFEDLGINYMGPIDGHSIGELVRTINAAKRCNEAVIIHCVTKKGKGYDPAETDPAAFHGIGKFDVKTGKPVKCNCPPSYTDIFSLIMNGMAREDNRLVAVCAAMKDGVGLSYFAKHFRKRFFDVGIAEQHAVTMSAGLAAGGLKPYVAIYSSFLQRAYDQIVHDVCMQNLPVTFCIDRAGIVGADGATHQGIMDLSYLSMMPNMTIMAPKNKYEFFDMMQFSRGFNGPLAIRYPRGEAYNGLSEYRQDIEIGKSELIYKGEEVAIIAIGNMVREAEKTVKLLKGKSINATLINGRFVKPMDTDMIDKLVKNHKLIVTMEDNLLAGGYGEEAAAYLERMGYRDTEILNIGIDDTFVEHGDTGVIMKLLGIDGESVANKIINKLK